MNQHPDTPASGARLAGIHPVSDTMLQGYVDGLLKTGERAQTEAWLAAHPEQALRVASDQRINASLHALYDPVLEEAQPARFGALLAGAEAGAAAAPARPAPTRPDSGLGAWLKRRLGAGRPRGWLAPALSLGTWGVPAHAATLAWLTLGVALGLGLQPQPAPPRPGLPPMVKHAAVAYVTYASETTRPVEIQASEETQLVAWLSRRLGLKLKAAKLDDVGFTLMGGRLLAGTQRPVAQFMYEDQVGRRLTLYIKTQESEHDQSASFRFAREGEVNAFYWIEDGTGYVLSGNLERAEMLKVAQAVYRQLNAPAPGAGPHPALRAPGAKTA